MEPLFRRSYDAARLIAEHPLVLRHPNKQLLFALACPPGAEHHGTIEVTRWRAASLPEAIVLHDTAISAEATVYDYSGPDAGVWHVNFADSRLFVAYGSALLAQDELQAVEHPVLGSIREALLAEGDAALTLDREGPSPMLVTGVERRCALRGIYGNAFARASEGDLRKAVTIIEPPTRSNLIAIAAPSGGRGRYSGKDITRVLTTAVTGFSAAVAETRRLWPGTPVEVRTGFWGCGAFGGNRHAMVLLQLLSARLAGVDRLRFYAVDVPGLADFESGAADLAEVLAARAADEPMFELIERIEDLGYLWGTSDGT